METILVVLLFHVFVLAGVAFIWFLYFSCTKSRRKKAAERKEKIREAKAGFKRAVEEHYFKLFFHTEPRTKERRDLITQWRKEKEDLRKQYDLSESVSNTINKQVYNNFE